jgi:hypothetical protein
MLIIAHHWFKTLMRLQTLSGSGFEAYFIRSHQTFALSNPVLWYNNDLYSEQQQVHWLRCIGKFGSLNCCLPAAVSIPVAVLRIYCDGTSEVRSSSAVPKCLYWQSLLLLRL